VPRQATDEVIETVERWGHLGLAAHALGVQRTSLENRLKKAGVWDADRHGFTPREDATIRLEYEPGSVMSLADQLDRSWLSVVRRAFRIGAIDTSGAEELLDGDGIEVQGTAQPVGVIAPGDPVAWQRAGRVSDRTFTPKIVEKAEQRLACRFATILTMRLNVSLHCVFYRATMRSADVDNLVKLVLDAGNDGALWEDDSQVTTLVTRVTIDRENPRMAWSVARNLALATTFSEPERQWAALTRAEARARLSWLLPPGTILCMPTTPFPAPRKGLPLAILDPLRARITCLTAHGGLTGVPQVTLPGAQVNGLPVGLSILAARGADATLVAVAKAMEAGE